MQLKLESCSTSYFIDGPCICLWVSYIFSSCLLCSNIRSNASGVYSRKKWKIECTYFTPLFGHKDVIMIKLHHEAHSSEWRCLLIYICTPDIISLEMSCCLRTCLSFHHWIRADFSSHGIRWFVGAHTPWDQSFVALMASYRNISSIVWKIVLGWSFQYFSFNCSVITTSQHISIQSNNVCSGIPTYPLLDTG